MRISFISLLYLPVIKVVFSISSTLPDSTSSFVCKILILDLCINSSGLYPYILFAPSLKAKILPSRSAAIIECSVEPTRMPFRKLVVSCNFDVFSCTDSAITLNASPSSLTSSCVFIVTRCDKSPADICRVADVNSIIGRAIFCPIKKANAIPVTAKTTPAVVKYEIIFKNGFVKLFITNDASSALISVIIPHLRSGIQNHAPNTSSPMWFVYPFTSNPLIPFKHEAVLFVYLLVSGSMTVRPIAVPS